jgi:hypothetical protein
VRLWAKRGALAPVPGSKPTQIEHDSLRRTGRALRELRAKGQDHEWLEAILSYIKDIGDRSNPSVRRGLRDLAEGKLQPA